MPLNANQIAAGVIERPDGTISFSGGPPAPIASITAGFLGRGPAQNNVHGTGQGFDARTSMGSTGGGGFGPPTDEGFGDPWGDFSKTWIGTGGAHPAPGMGGMGAAPGAPAVSKPFFAGPAPQPGQPQMSKPFYAGPAPGSGYGRIQPVASPPGMNPNMGMPGSTSQIQHMDGRLLPDGTVVGRSDPRFGADDPSMGYPGGNPVGRPNVFGGQPGGFGGQPGTMPVPGAAPIGGPGVPFGGVQQGEFENRGVSQSGLDPRLDGMYQFALQQAMAQFGNPNGQQFYGGPTVAQLSPDERMAQESLRGAAGQVGGMGGEGMDLFSQLVQRGINPGADATLNGAIDATLMDTRKQVLNPGGIFSQIRGNSVANGSFGGSRQGVLESLGMKEVAETMSRTAGDMRLQGRQQNVQNAQNAVNSIPTLMNAATAPGTILGAVGEQNRNMEQRNLDDNLRRWGYNTFEPDRRLDSLFSRIGAAPLGGWNANSSTLGSGLVPGANGGTSNTQNILGGVTGALGIWDLLKQAGIFGGS